MANTKYDLSEVLPHLDPALLSYQEWLNVGMAMKDAGYTCREWEAWSRRDVGRFHEGECARKWAGFHGSPTPVTGGTIVQLAREQGWEPLPGEGYELDWDSAIGSGHPGRPDRGVERDERIVVDRNWIESKDVPEPEDFDPVRELTRYLELLFEASETVGYVTQSWEKEGRYLPAKGAYDRTAGQLIELLSQCRDGDIGSVVGDYRDEAGAWIRFNPLDGNGVKNENVTEYRYALVESDSMPVGQQHAIIRELELPVAVLVHSGKKSLHAIVHIDAANYDEYRKRVDYLYDVCQKNGLKVDAQNRNPSRLSRMPGVTRDGHRQFIVAENIGKESYEQWHEWIEGVNDDLPEPENLAAVWDNLPALAPPLIEGMLRQGHKMLLAGPSKAGKSYSLIELCIAIAEGTRWLTWRCAKGKVMYVNLELDEASCWHRFKDVYGALQIEAKNLNNIDIWNLRGKAIPMDKLAPKLIRRAAKKHYTAIVIDPIYKIITGDENSADQMANFCNQFDKVCTELSCAVIYCHHHSKGQQGQKRSMDRASGSGVFARDPDAMIDMIELDVPENLAKAEGERALCEVCCEWLNRCVEGWEDKVSQDAICSPNALAEACRKLLSETTYRVMMAEAEAKKATAMKRTAWRIEGTLREFAPFEPVNLWFDYPIHRVDMVGVLGDIEADGALEPWERGAKKRREKAAEKRDNDRERFDMALASNYGEPVTVKVIADFLSTEKHTMSERTVRDWIKKYGYMIDRNRGYIVTKREDDDE